MTANQITIVGNLTEDPELRFIQSGDAVCNLTVADTPRVFNRETNQWEDAPNTLYLRSTMWRNLAENVAETLKKGMEVIVVGRLVSRSWTTDGGEKRSVNEIQVEHIGPSLRWMTGEMKRASANGGNRGGAQGQRPASNQGQQSQRPTQGQATPPPSSDEPPF